MKTRKFTLEFHRKSAHRVGLVIHESRAAMRRDLKRRGHDTWQTTEACCWQCGKIPEDNVIAEMHFGADRLTLDSLAHECCHAAFHRSKLIGLIPGSDDWQEYTATDTGILTEQAIAVCKREGYRLRVKAAIRLARARRRK